MKYDFDPLERKYHSIRYPIYAKGGMVNCSSPQATCSPRATFRSWPTLSTFT
ncbi:MAG: hypothetical protein II918_06150 [Firmicutes bacterium]|nr:hypothetical protein [Bacillota bacterium]